MATAAAETVIPATPAGYRFTEWLDTFNRGDAIEITEYLQQHFPNAPPRIKDVPAFRSYVGHLEPKRIEEASDFSFDCLAKERDSDKYWRVHWRVASETPWHILEYWVSPAKRPADIAPMPRLSERNTVAAVSSSIGGRRRA